ncbi:hypothetical protein ASPBRDRAFT_40200 [Aspergillus brasiliensis CBS 101740]|uniref:Uncharacterized protein n=1 Tax=Aspergillus brasiliensis (strain CBS 101740 / IMI 381727 / IBT 21946) TaxID=767769 RepID=A0A1L9UTN8_ASPBC|nr:hypothetical protein ASPBRDRAFT_40200 [Aspergillus brasiliensis CBS 101740]
MTKAQKRRWERNGGGGGGDHRGRTDTPITGHSGSHLSNHKYSKATSVPEGRGEWQIETSTQQSRRSPRTTPSTRISHDDTTLGFGSEAPTRGEKPTMSGRGVVDAARPSLVGMHVR